MSIGTNIKSLREERKLTQEQVAEVLGVTFQAVSSWERDEYKPDTDKLIKLAEIFDVSVSTIAEERHKTFKTKETIYNWEHMKTYVKTTAKNFKLRTSFWNNTGNIDEAGSVTDSRTEFMNAFSQWVKDGVPENISGWYSKYNQSV